MVWIESCMKRTSPSSPASVWGVLIWGRFGLSGGPGASAIVGGAATFLVVIRLYGAKAKKRILAMIGRTPAKADHNTHAAE